MSGRTYVDGTDIYEAYGVYVTSGGWSGLVAMPPLKEPESNDWQEEDGVEVDLSAPVLDTKEATVSFACGSSASRLFDFIALLSDGAYHEFDCAWIGRTYRLRMVSQPKMSYNPALGTFSLKLADDFPPGFTDDGPEGGVDAHGDYALDGTDVAAYGVRVLSGTLSNVLSTPDVKQGLLRNISVEAGAEYDSGADVTFKGKDVKVNCLMRAGTLEGLWRNWDALLRDLVKPDARRLWVAGAGQTFPCRYKSCSVTAFNPVGRIWLQFTLTLAFTGDLRIDMGDWLLSSEAGELVTTEDGEDCIDMRPLSPTGTEYGASPTYIPVETYAEGGVDSGIRKVRVSELPECADLKGLWTLGTDSGNDSVKVSLEFVGEAAESADRAAEAAGSAAVNANEAANAANLAAQSVGDAADRAESAATNANAAADSANQAATDAGTAAQSADTAANNADSAASSANTAAQFASDAATNATTAAQSASEAAASATDAATSADTAATNANAAAQAAYEAVEALGDIANIVPITDEEIDGLLEGFRFIDSFTVTAEGEYPLTLEAENGADGAEITGSVDIDGIPEGEITEIFNG